jgi:tetratricopeptide (TPR) repeat protein
VTRGWLRCGWLVFCGLAAIARGSGTPDVPPTPFAAALELYGEHRYSKAREIFEQLAVGRPDDPELDFYLGRLALWFDEEAKGLAHLEKAAKALPNDARIQDALGDAYGLTAQKAPILTKYSWARKCRAAYERAVALDPTNPAYHWSLLAYYQSAPRFAGGGIEKAFAQAAEIRSLDPVGGRTAYADVCLAEGKAGEAFAQFDEVLRRTPDDFMALYNIGRCAAVSGEQLDRGIAAMRKCLRLQPPPGDGRPRRVNVIYRLGNLFEKKGDAAAARVEYEIGRRTDPDFRPDKDSLKN